MDNRIRVDLDTVCITLSLALVVKRCRIFAQNQNQHIRWHISYRFGRHCFKCSRHHTHAAHILPSAGLSFLKGRIYIYCLRRTKQEHCVSPKRTSICVCVLVVFASFWRHQKTWLELRFVIWSSKMRFRNLHAPHHLPAGGPWDEDPRRGCNWSPGSFYCKHFAKFVHVWLIVPDGKEWFYVSNTNIQPSNTRANTSIQKKTVRFELSHPILTIYTSHMPRYPYIYIYV